MNELPLLNVLIVDDSTKDYRTTCALLAEIDTARFHTDHAANRPAALARMKAGTPGSGSAYDLCLLDYRITGGNGLGIVREAISQGFTAPIILLTGQEDTLSDREGMEAGAFDYLIKGYTNATLLERSIRYARQQRRTQDQLRESREQFRSLVEVTSDWIWEVDAAGRYKYISPQIKESLGYSPAELLGKTPFDFMPVAERERVQHQSREITSARRAFQDLESEMLSRGGKRVFMEISGTPLFDTSGAWNGYRGVNRDITARKKAEEELNRQNAFVSAILDTAGALVIVLDRDGKIVRFNRACEVTTGYAFAEVSVRPFWEILLTAEERERVKAVFDELTAGHFPNQYENDWITRTGEHRRIAWSNTALLNPSGTVDFVVSTGIDVTERRRVEDQLAQAHEREVEVGATIQRTLLVGEPPAQSGGLNIGMITIPSQKVGGDYLDFFVFREGIVDVLVGDVMGKGVSAALLAAAAKSHFQQVTRRLSLDLQPLGRLPEPEEVVEAVHAALTPDLYALHSFVTLSYARFDLEQQLLTLVDCGHPRPLHLRSGDSICRDLSGHNMPLGMNPDERYRQVTFPFAPDDLFLFYSDGLVEAHSENEREVFGQERLAGLLLRHARQSPQEIASAACEAVRDFAGRKADTDGSDDLTCVAVRIPSSSNGDGGAALSTPLQTHHLEIGSSPVRLEEVRQFVENVCSFTSASAALVDLVALALNEAVANVIQHAYRGREGHRVRIAAERYQDRLRFRLFDNGHPFAACADIPLPSFDGSRDNGFGVYIIRQCMDSVEYRRDEMGRNCLTLVKYLPLSENKHGK